MWRRSRRDGRVWCRPVYPQPRADKLTTALGPEPTEQSVPAEDARRRVTLAEALLLAAATVVGLVALVSLAAAHLGHHTPAVVGVGSVLLIAAVAVVVFVLDRPTVRLDLAGLAPVGLGLIFAAIMVFPGFEYGTGDRDPGAYVEHAVAITHSHSIEFPDDLAKAGLSGGVSPGAQWPALWDKPGHTGTIFPQFYHLWPALLATAKDAGGFTGLFNTGPLLAVIAVGLAVAVARRLGGIVAAWAVAVLLPANMLEVWQAKYPTAEIFGQMLYIGALLGVVLAVRAGWRTAAALGGVLIGLSYLERADGIVLVLLAWAALAVLLAARRFDSRAAWFTGGLCVLLPYGFYQAYDLARKYTLANSVPSLPKVLAAMVGIAIVGAVLAWQGRLVASVIDWATPRRRVVLGSAFVVLCGGLMLIGGLRPKLFGQAYQLYLGRRIRSYDEISLIRLSWFFSLPGLALMLAGFGYVAWRRWRFDRWVVALTTAGLLTLYCYHVRNSPYLMWATRRFVTTVVPGMVVLMGLGAALIVVVLRRYVHVLAAVGAAAALVVGISVFGLTESWPLRSHNENGGSVEVEQQIAALAGAQRGVFLWQRAGACCDAPYQLFGGPLLAITDQSSALLPRPGGLENAALARYAAYFKGSGRPMFYIADESGTPPPVAGVSSAKVLELAGTLPHWEETFTSRPKKRHDYPYHITVYRLQAS
jgi:hypothetical protein